MRATRPASSFRTWLGPRRLRLRFVDFLVRIWLLNACPHLNLPDAVFRNRLAAARLVLILGMLLLHCLGSFTDPSDGLPRSFHPARICFLSPLTRAGSNQLRSPPPGGLVVPSPLVGEARVRGKTFGENRMFGVAQRLPPLS